MGNTNFWVLHAGLALASAVLFACLARPLNCLFAATSEAVREASSNAAPAPVASDE